MPKIKAQLIPGIAKSSMARALDLLGSAGVVKYSGHTHQQKPINYAVKQKFQFDRHFSDHLMATFSLGAYQARIRSFNTMMQATGNNTAYKDYVETDEEYIVRYTKILDALNQELRSSDSIDFDTEIIALQEAPIKNHLLFVEKYINTHFPDEWRINHSNVTYDSTSWGVLTLIKHNPSKTSKPYLDSTLTQGIPIKSIDIRCRTFAMLTDSNKLIKLTNLHLPHGNPEEAFTAFMTNVVRDIIQNGATRKVFGDFNIDAERMDLIVRQIIIKEIESAPQGNITPFTLSTQILSSREGHIKQDARKVNVDACIVFEKKPSEEFSFNVNITNDKFAISFFAVLASTLFVGVAAFDEDVSQDVHNEMEPISSAPRM